MSSNSMMYSERGVRERSAIHGEAAGNTQYLTGDESGVVAGEEDYRARQIVRLSDAAKRDRPDEGLHQLLGVARTLLVIGEESGVGRARTDHVHRDAVARVLPRDGLGEGDQPALAGGVHRFAGGAD